MSTTLVLSPYTPFRMSTDAYRHLAASILDVHNYRVGTLCPTQPNACARASFQRFNRLVHGYAYTLDRPVIRNLEVCSENEVEKGIYDAS